MRAETHREQLRETDSDVCDGVRQADRTSTGDATGGERPAVV